jgi:hypothetical protein
VVGHYALLLGSLLALRLVLDLLLQLVRLRRIPRKEGRSLDLLQVQQWGSQFSVFAQPGKRPTLVKLLRLGRVPLPQKFLFLRPGRVKFCQLGILMLLQFTIAGFVIRLFGRFCLVSFREFSSDLMQDGRHLIGYLKLAPGRTFRRMLLNVRIQPA